LAQRIWFIWGVGSWTFGTAYLVDLVDLVDLVHLVDLVRLVFNMFSLRKSQPQQCSSLSLCSDPPRR
jgi:hypothetical protein